MSADIFDGEGRINLAPPDAERLRAAVRHVFGNTYGIKYPFRLSVSGFEPEEVYEINGHPVEQAPPDEIEALMVADRAVEQAAREAGSQKYLKPETNPFIKTDPDLS